MVGDQQELIQEAGHLVEFADYTVFIRGEIEVVYIMGVLTIELRTQLVLQYETKMRVISASA